MSEEKFCMSEEKFWIWLIAILVLEFWDLLVLGLCVFILLFPENRVLEMVKFGKDPIEAKCSLTSQDRICESLMVWKAGKQ